MTVREATPQDAQAVRQIRAQGVADLRKVYRPALKATTQSPAGAPASPARRQFVCECDGSVAGVAQCELRERSLHVIGLFVHPDLRRRGVARKIIDHLAALARQEGKPALSLYTVRQTGNVAIFQRLGFTVARESPCDSDESVTGEPLTDVYMERPLA